MNELQYRGETLIATFLKQRGHTILARNKRFGFQEIDIISRRGTQFFITEVKARSQPVHDLGTVFTPVKIHHLLSVQMRYYPKSIILCFLVLFTRSPPLVYFYPVSVFLAMEWE